MNVEGLKIWDDEDDQDAIRPESITITLLADGEPLDPDMTVTVTADENGEFKWSFEDLPRFKNLVDEQGNITQHGHEIVYSFEEAEIAYPSVLNVGYLVSYTEAEFHAPAEDEEGVLQNAYWSIEVTNFHEPETIDFSFYKFGQVIEGNEVAENTKPLAGVTFTLFEDEECTVPAEMYVTLEDGTITTVPSTAVSDEDGFVNFGKLFFKVTGETVEESGDVVYTYEPQTYYMKETDIGEENKDTYWDNDTVYMVVATPRNAKTGEEASVVISVVDGTEMSLDGEVFTGMLSEDGTTIENDLVNYEIILEKVDETDKEIMIEGAKFDLYTVPAEKDGAVIEDLPTVEEVEDTYVKLDSDLVTDKDGKINLGKLTVGTYYLVETEAPAGYYKLDDPVQLTVAKVTADMAEKLKEDIPEIKEGLGLISVKYNVTVIKEGKSEVVEHSDNYLQEKGAVPAITVTVTDQPKYGNLTIVKYLKSFELSEDATFVFTVVGTIDDEVVYSNVATLTCSTANPSGVLSTTLNYIPAGAMVTVTESYSGSHYVLASKADWTIEIVANDTVSVDFTNDYTPDEKGGHGIVNTFEPDDSALGWHWGGSNVSSTPDEPAALPPAPAPTGDEGDESEGGSGDGSGDGDGETSGGETSGGNPEN